jgi:hypothetical protein
MLHLDNIARIVKSESSVIDWKCCSHERNGKFIRNFGGEPYCKTATLKADKGGLIILTGTQGQGA